SNKETASLEAIKGEKQQATSEITEAKNTIIIKTLIFLRLNKACKKTTIIPLKNASFKDAFI
ncbi:hypothetical protein ACLF8V_06950, partial [Helicobacter pylori]